MLSSITRLLPKAAAQALIALAVTGGAIGASAAAGGPNVPAETLKAVGLVNQHTDDDAEDNGKSQAPGQIRQATATASAGLTRSENARDNGLKGLCNAYMNGGLGQNAQAKGVSTPAAAPLARLDGARGSDSRAEFCADVLAKHNASKGSTAEAGDQGKGKALGKAKHEEAGSNGQSKSAAAPGKAR